MDDMEISTDDAAPGTSVTRAVDIEADIDVVWEAVADPERRRAWLDDGDAAERLLRIDRADPGRAVTWTWWRPDDIAGASRVDVLLTQLDTGGTRVRVTERLVTPPTTAASATRGRVRADRANAARVWDYRLLGLELLGLHVGICVG